MRIPIGADPFPPYQFQTENGVEGLDYELVMTSFAHSGIEIDVFLKVWPQIESDYDDGLVRALFQVQPTEKRARSNLFSGELRRAVTEIITADTAGPPITIDTFRSDHILAALEGYSYGDHIDTLPEDRKRRYSTQEGLLKAVADGSEQFGVFDRGVRFYLQRELGLENVTSVDGMEFFRPLTVMFRGDDEELRDTFDRGLETIKRDGTYESILRKWE